MSDDHNETVNEGNDNNDFGIEQSNNFASIWLGAVKFTEWLDSARRAANEFLAKLEEYVRPIVDIAIYLKEFEERYKIAEAEAIKVLRKYKWIIAPSMPVSFLAEVIELAGQSGNRRGKINKLFIDYFSENNFAELEELVESWSDRPLFKPRMKIFRDCVNVLKCSDGTFNASNLVLPTLIAQIDGILTEYTKSNAIYRNDNKWKEQFRLHATKPYMADVANALLLDYLFQKAVAGKPLEVPFTFNRHKVLHGEYIQYGRMEHSIRAFLVLDFLSGL